MTGTPRNAIRWLRSDNLKSKSGPADENLKLVGLVTLVITFVICGVAVEAQQPTKIPRIGYLNANFPTTNPDRIEAIRQVLRELGYVEGKNIVIEWRYAERKPNHLAALAAELVRLKVALIVTSASGETRAAKEATSTILLS
jgi:putative ABC transport system substrate-binding protein